MARKPRLEYAGAIYHVMSRGDHSEAVFRTDADRVGFLSTLGEVCERTGWRIHAYVLMGNHYHLLLETPEPNLVVGMPWLQGTYAKRFNAAHRVWGHLFSGRYKAIPVDPTPNYFLAVADYIHLNPVRVKGYNFETAMLPDYAWSSYPGYVLPGKRPGWLCVQRVMGDLGLADSRSGRMRFARHMESRVQNIRHADKPWEADERWKTIRRGWHLGGETFKSEMLDRISGILARDKGTPFGGDAIQAHDERRAVKGSATFTSECGDPPIKLQELVFLLDCAADLDACQD
jgi:REP element-mobilizing transposase RayT